MTAPEDPMLSDPAPWLNPVAGSELLGSIEKKLSTYVAINEAARVAAPYPSGRTLWVALT